MTICERVVQGEERPYEIDIYEEIQPLTYCYTGIQNARERLRNASHGYSTDCVGGKGAIEMETFRGCIAFLAAACVARCIL